VKRRELLRIQSSKKGNFCISFFSLSDLKQYMALVNISAGKSKVKELFGIFVCRWTDDITMVVM
jgi:hypothetical protein